MLNYLETILMKKCGVRRSKTKKTPDAISLLALCKEFNLVQERLIFAIAETYDGEDSCETSPVALICGTDEYIDLAEGVVKKNARSRGLVQNFFDCRVEFSGDKFIFVNPKVKAEISAENLVKNFGEDILI